jgi:hypothetical protein
MKSSLKFIELTKVKIFELVLTKSIQFSTQKKQIAKSLE